MRSAKSWRFKNQTALESYIVDDITRRWVIRRQRSKWHWAGWFRDGHASRKQSQANMSAELADPQTSETQIEHEISTKTDLLSNTIIISSFFTPTSGQRLFGYIFIRCSSEPLLFIHHHASTHAFWIRDYSCRSPSLRAIRLTRYHSIFFIRSYFELFLYG